MELTIEWLPLGHITHGYRRVFIVRQGSETQNVVVLAPMPYEVVYEVKQSAGGKRLSDPALWWGLSSVTKLIDEGGLDQTHNPELADDGYVLHRPAFSGPDQLIPIQAFYTAIENGKLMWPLSQTQV